MGGPEKGRIWVISWLNLFGGSVLGDGFGTFRDSVLGQFTWKEKSDSSLDFTWWDCWSLIIFGQSRGFTGDTIKNITNKGVHDVHGLGGNSSVWVNLFQDFVDVDGVWFPPSPLPFLVSSSLGLSLGGGLLCSFTSYFWWHVYTLIDSQWMTRQ